MREHLIEQFERLESRRERARFLLDVGVTARMDIEDMEPVFRACAGDLVLPITASTELLAVRRAVGWLREIASDNAANNFAEEGRA